ncbi:MAG: hypothetical protein KJ676_04405 [Alphaproteobacteria bacterium]|nr:hypothetical protein [Alphaproteobacteria bacterium]MBU1527145.1 hypothetical protein [Alphaproteobacteria bacterium]MBU2116618.1 hypothetical protein [Alphaproteobacteria bacterium]MBU2350659.1 hypothetical protein [Alphaproteobacteria bacterium]MBU2383276.1 hypothetical protein [Alphaproteobacteria bacterium]
MSRPDPAPSAGPPTNPPWVRWAVIGLILLVWISAGISILLGEPWGGAVIPAVAATLCLSAVDLGLDLRRKARRRS